MRNTAIRTLEAMAKKNKGIYLITGDLGFSVVEGFQKSFPQRFINAGIAEQNMIGVAAGLALSGKKPFVYSIVPFVTMRCFEQIRNDVCYQNVDVKLIGVGAGFSYGTLGSTHHAIEDISIMRSLPNMTVVCPGDPKEAEAVIRESVKHRGPLYIRLGKGGEVSVHKSESLKNFKFGKGIVLKKEGEITIISTGSMLAMACKVSENLGRKGIRSGLISMHTIKPIDSALLIDFAKKTKMFVTIEEHNIIGGLGSAVSDVICENDLNTRLLKCGIPDAYPKKIGTADYMRRQVGLDAETITTKVMNFIGRKPRTATKEIQVIR